MPAAARRLPRSLSALAALVLLAVSATAYIAFQGTRPEAPVLVAPVAPVAVTPPAPEPAPPPAEPLRPAPPPGALTVSESGVGRRIVDSRLEGESDRFDRGARVCFATRVLGGHADEIIRHVWIREGRVEQSIPLRLGGPDWRTHSNKTLGNAGAWAAEARDAKGNVLARATFTCAQPDPGVTAR